MTKHEDNLINVLKGALKGRDNPVDLKPVYIGKIVNLSPIKVSIFDGKVILTEDDDLYISEQFRLRCNIDKTSALSSDVLNNKFLLSVTLNSFQGLLKIDAKTSSARQ